MATIEQTARTLPIRELIQLAIDNENFRLSLFDCFTAIRTDATKKELINKLDIVLTEIEDNEI